MACCIYNIEPDKVFLCCNDIEVLEVYEIDSLYLSPVQQKHWTDVATLNFGEGRECKAIKFGDKEIIEGCDLERLMRELLSLGMMVNREGLCFLKQESSCSVGQVNYFRMFDKFDWSKYQVKVSVSTRWICSDIGSGRPMLDSFMQMMFKQVSEFAEAKDLHMSEFMELKRKHIEDIEDFKRKHLASVEQKIEDKSTLKEDELEDSNIHQSDQQVLIKALETLAGLMEFKKYKYPSQKVRLQRKLPIVLNDWKTEFYKPDSVCITINDMHALQDWTSFPGLSYHGSSIEPKFDRNNWLLVRVVRVWPHAKKNNLDTLIYYDGGYSTINIPSAGTIPVPLNSTEFEYVSSGMFFYVAGVGVRYGFAVDAAWKCVWD